MTLVVKSAVKDLISKKGKRTSSGALDALDEAVKDLIEKAIKRANMEKVETIKERHI